MALPKTDSFTGASNGTALTAYDANYSAGSGTLSINTESVYSSATGGGGIGCAFWNGDTFNNAQSSQGTLVAIGGSGNYGGLGVRMSGDEGYYIICSTGESFFGSLANGSPSDIGGDRGTWAANDVLKLAVDANFNFTISKNGSPVATPSDGGSLYATGKAGFMFYAATTSYRVDTVTFDHVAAGGRTSKNTRSWNLGENVGMGHRIPV